MSDGTAIGGTGSHREPQKSGFRARCNTCFWQGRERPTFAAAHTDLERHGEYADCWDAHVLAIYEDGTEAKA